MNRHQVWREFRVLFTLALLPCGFQLYGQQAEQAQGTAAKSGTFITFEAPGAGAGISQGTYPAAINNAGLIIGYYRDANNGTHGFLRDSNGTVTTFDAPDDVLGTYPSATNGAGVITGYYTDANQAGHGFVRARDGAITTFDPSGSSFTQPNSIDPAGVIVGNYYDENFLSHGFLRAASGSLTTFDVANAVGTQPESINPSGAVVGCYASGFVNHVFLRAPDGVIATIDPPGATNACVHYYYSGPFSLINPSGDIAAPYFLSIPGNPFGGDWRGFLRSPDGAFTTFDAATYPPCCIWTFPNAINAAGLITGYFNDGYGINHGFLRQKNGIIVPLDGPGAQSTIAVDINRAGNVTGYYVDASGVTHGFLWTP